MRRMNSSKITRIEIIWEWREYTKQDLDPWSIHYSLQDNGKTLKLFLYQKPKNNINEKIDNIRQRRHKTWWSEIINTFCDVAELLDLDDDTVIMSKEKYWTLRLDCFSNSIILQKLAEICEKASETTCDMCWNYWILRDDLWWRRTLCDKCYNQVLPKIRSASK